MTENQEGMIFIGQKPLMNYVNASQMQLKRTDEIKILARGRNISKAVDVVEVCKRFMDGNAIVGEIQIASEEIEDKKTPGRKVNISSIEISLKNKKAL